AAPGSSDAAADGSDAEGSDADEASAPVPTRTARWTKATHFPTVASDLLPRIGVATSLAAAQRSGVKVTLTLTYPVKRVAWHKKGDYLVTITPAAPSGAVMVHQLSKHASQCPFAKNKGKLQMAVFHPSKPLLYVANQRSVRVYDLVKGDVQSKLECSVKWISTLEMHPSGDHVVVGSYDHRTVWFDTELSNRPYKTLRYHSKAVRRAAFHPTLPLMATASDDGTVHVFHTRVYHDFVTNPLIVPVKILRGHTVTSDGLGVLDCVFHPTQPWLISAGADHTLQLWHNLP
ncbi:hypothetical protein EON62_03145, partial [archaeon]